MERLEIETSLGTKNVFFEVTTTDIILCSVPLIGTVRVPWHSAIAFCKHILEVHELVVTTNIIPKTKKKR
jgi:hypothetical protein